MTPSITSLTIGLLVGTVSTIILMGYTAAPADRCKIVADVYQRTHDSSPPLRGTEDDGLNLAESSAIDAANVVSRALGVSCYVEGRP